MRLTPAGKFLLFVVGLAVLGYAAWTYRDRLPGALPGMAGAPSSVDAGTVVGARAGASAGAQGRARLGPADRRAPRRHGAGGAAASLPQRSKAGRRVRLPPCGNHRRQPGRQAHSGRRGRLRRSAGSSPLGRGRRDHGRLRARPVDRRRRLVERLSRLRPLPDRARGHGSDVPLGQGSRRQAHRDLRRSGGRALGAAEHPGRAHQQVLGRQRVVRGGGAGPGGRARSTTIRSPPRRSRRTRGRSSCSTT